MYQPGMGAGGGAAGAGLGSLGRSPLLDLLKPLDYPRQALWNMVRGGGRLAGGEGSLDDLLGMVPGLAGAGMAALGPLGMLGGALAGGAVQGLGKMTGSNAFEAATPQDITGSEDFLPNLAVGAATDPLTYTGLGFGRHAPVPESAAGEQAGRMKMGLAPEYTGGEGGLLGPSRQPLLDPIYHAHPLEGIEPPPLSAPPIPEASPLPAAGPAPLSPDQAFEQMLPDYRRYSRAQAAVGNPRNFTPEEFRGMNTHEADALRDVPAARLHEFTTPQTVYDEPVGGLAGMDPAALATARQRALADAQQFRRSVGARRAFEQTGRQLEQHAPLAAQLAKSGQLGPIESRLQTNWGILGDMAQDQYLTPQQLLQQARAAQLEDEAFQTLFERFPTEASPQQIAAQQAIMQQLLAELGQAHPGLAGVSARDAFTAMREAGPPIDHSITSSQLAAGVPNVVGTVPQFGGRPVTPQQVEQARLAATLGDQTFPGRVPATTPPLPTPLPAQILQDLRAQGTPPGMFAGNPAYPGQPYAGLGGPGPGPYGPTPGNPLAALDPRYEGTVTGGGPLQGAHPLEDVGFTSNPFTSPGPADLGGMDLLPHELAHMVPQAPAAALAPPLPAGPVPPTVLQAAAAARPPLPPPPSLLPRGLHTEAPPPLDWAPPRPGGVDLQVQGQFAPGSQQGLGQFIEQLQENLGRPLTRQERALMMQMPPQRMQQVLQTPPADLEQLLRSNT